MADVASVADSHGAWLKFAPSSMSDEQWEVAAKTPEAVLSHRSCPWGGHLIKIDSKSIFVQEAPGNPGDVLVRPEVEAMFGGYLETQQCLEIYAPGDVLIQRTNSMWIMRFAAVLFGSCHDSLGNRLYHETVVSHYRLYKDFPEPGDCTCFALEAMWALRRVPGSVSHYRSVLVFNTPEDKWATWASPFYPGLTLMFHKVFDKVLNGPTFRDLRATDASMYLVLTLHSFNRGHPMVPQSKACEDSVTIAAGKHLGLMSWTRFKPHEKFRLGEYIRDFLERLGYQLKTYEAMDGRKLVRYQCVVVRQQWDELRTSFFEAFQVQKAAYRRENGGTAAPALVEDAAPRFDLRGLSCCDEPVVIKTIVRKTFVELDDEGSEYSAGCLKRSNSVGEVLVHGVC